MAGDGVQRLLALLDNDGLAAFHRAVAVAVADHQGAAALDELGEVRVVVLGTGQNHLAAVVGLGIRLAGLHLFGRLSQLVENQVLGADQGGQLDHLKLISGDGGVIQLSVVADLVDQAADLVVLLNGLHQRFVGDVDAELLVQLAQHVVTELLPVMLVVVLRSLEGHVDEFAEEVVVLDDVHPLQVLLEAAGDGAGLRGHLGVQEVEAALQSAFKQAASVVADTGGHVVGRNVRRCAARRSQSHREAAGQVEKHFRHEIAGVANGVFPLGLCLLDKRVVGFLKQILKVNQVFEIFQK